MQRTDSLSEGSFGPDVRKQRLIRRLTQQNLVDLVYMKGTPFSQSWLSQIENERVPIGELKMELIVTLCEVLRLNADDYFE